MDYASLRKQIIDAGLMERQYGYYAHMLVILIVLLISSISIIMLVNNVALQLLNAVFLAFVMVRFAMVMHDAGHQQIFKSGRNNDLIGVFVSTISMVSSSSWSMGHNIHHNSPNKIGEDPDLEIPLLAYTEEDALETKGVVRFLTKYQAYLWIFIMATAGVVVRFNHTKRLLLMSIGNHDNHRWKFAIEFVLLLLANAAFFFMIFWFLSVPLAIAFLAINYVAVGIYIGTVFATNHKGMPLMKEKIDFVKMQVLTTRNVRPSPVIDFWTAGLNYQIEHHLFQTMPRNNLSKAKKYVEAFCEDVGVEYYETGFFNTYKEVVQNFHNVSAVLRKPKSVASKNVAAP